MNPQHVRVQNYKCIDDTGWIELDDLTCLIGKNEAGKTVLMEAITRLNPVHGDGSFTPYDDYPRRRWPEYKDRHESDPDPVVSLTLTLDDDERERLESRGGYAEDGDVVVTKNYANELTWTFDLDEREYVDALRSAHDIDGSADDEVTTAESVSALSEALDDALDADTAGDDDAYAALAESLPASPDAAIDDLGNEILAPELPSFHYVGEYTTLDAEIDLDSYVDRREHGEATESDRVFASLLSVAGLDVDALRTDEDWRGTVTELEAASSEITDAVTRYWSQADDVEIHLRGHENDGSRSIELRVENPHHGVTVEFDQRSRGFRWFFSTFCTVYNIRRSADVVLLLDEPGLHLHPKAKREFLAFLEREVTTDGMLVYSTHSPFMIDVDRAHQTKMVRKDPSDGTAVFTDPGVADEYTKYPLQNVFELDVLETLVSRSQLLLVEDGTTYEYLYNVSELLEGTDAAVLDRGWTVIPIGTVENTQTVRAAFDTAEREVAVIHDGSEIVGWDPPEDVTVVGIGAHARVDGAATIEDTLSESFYLELVNRTYAAAISESADAPDRIRVEELAEYGRNAPIVERLEAFFADYDIAGGTFDRAQPAAYLQRNRRDFLDEVDMDTRKAFGSLARSLNKTLDSFDGERKQSGGFLGSLFGG